MTEITMPEAAADLLVTGVTGKVGGGVARVLTEQGIPFLALVRDPACAPDWLALPPRIADYRDSAALKHAMAGLERVLVVAPDEQVELGIAVVDAAARAGVAEIVRISAIGASDSSSSELLRNHAEGERHLDGTGLSYVHLRCNSFYENVLGLATWIRESDEFYWCGEDFPVAWIGAADVAGAAAAVLAAGCDKTTYDLTGPSAITWSEIADELGAVIGRLIRAVRVPPDEFLERAAAARWSPWMSREWIAMFTGEFGSEVGARLSGDVERLVGRPATPFRSFLDARVDADPAFAAAFAPAVHR